jgi:carbon-monoxide dehydrogenase large subunit
VSAARTAPGVLAVLTAADLKAAGVGTLPCALPAKNRDGSPMIKPPRPVLATDRVRFRGEPVVFIAAETLAAARDAAELIEFEIEPLPVVTDAAEAKAAGAPLLHDEAPNNVALDWEFGDGAAVDKIFAQAHHVTTLKMRNNRVHVSAMEPRAALAAYDSASERYTLHVPSQGVFGFTNGMAGAILNIPREKLRVQTYDVGGSFGMKSSPYPEYVCALVAAKQLQRPVKWCDERSDSFLSDQHGRDSYSETALAFDADGKILAGRVHVTCNLGA